MKLADIEKYNEKYNHIPKDYVERIGYLYNALHYTKDHLNSLLSKIQLLKKTEWEEVTYIFYMTPKATPRPRQNRNTFVFYVSDARNHKKIFDDFKENHSNMEVVVSTPCILETKVYLQTPAMMSKVEKLAAELELIHCVSKPDWDNLGKTYSDMIQKTLVSDDSIICKASVEKLYSILPRIEVTLKFMKSYDCKYNKKTVENRKSFYENDLTLKNLDHII